MKRARTAERSPRRVTPPEDIVEAARLMLREAPVESFSVRELARAMGLVPGTIYARFGTRDELLARVYIEWIREVIEQLSGLDVRSMTMADSVRRLAPIVGGLDGRFQQQPLPQQNIAPATWREMTHLFRKQAHVLYGKLQQTAAAEGSTLISGSLAEHLAWSMIVAAQRERTAQAFGHTQAGFTRFVAETLATTLAERPSG